MSAPVSAAPSLPPSAPPPDATIRQKPFKKSYATSKLRLMLFVGLVVAGFFACGAYAQSTPDAGGSTAAAPEHMGFFKLIATNMDFVFWIIMICSVIGLTLIIQGFIRNRRSVLMPDASIDHIRELIGQRQFKELIEFTETDPSFVSKALNPALKRAPNFASMKEAMETAIGEQTAESFRQIEYLNIIGNLGPLLGLLGTVLGMIVAFAEVYNAGGSTDVGKLSLGISKALCHTFLGLFLAIPCLAAFGVLRTIVDRLTIGGALVAEELLLMIKPSESKTSAHAAPARAVPAGAAAPVPRKAAVPVPPPPVPAQA